MRRKISLVIISIFLISFVSADIIITEQPNALYNLGDVMSVQLKIIVFENIKDSFKLNLLCNNQEIEVYKADIKINAGEEQKLDPIIILDKKRIGIQSGNCKIKASLGETYVLTNEFRISDLIIIELNKQEVEIAPEEKMIISGIAKKENGEMVAGFARLTIENTLIDIYDSVIGGSFKINTSFPKNTRAGQYSLNLNVYEKENQEISNSGVVNYNLLVKQVPTSLEIFFENGKINPGEKIKFKAILKDQTGEKIYSNVSIAIKNSEDKILQETQKSTDEFLEFQIPNNEKPSTWKVFANSNNILSNSQFEIKEKREIKVELVNKTLFIRNIGNVPYTGVLLVKIGNESKMVDVNLAVDKEQKYTLSAPDGEYSIEVLEEGKNKLTGMAILTGSAINVEKIGKFSFLKHPFVWVFLIGIFGFVAALIISKGYKKGIIGRIHHKNKENTTNTKTKQGLLVKSTSPAHISSSIQGEKQDASILCIKIRNFDEVHKSKDTGIKETLQRITKIAEENKAYVYENFDCIIFVWAPIKTKNTQNEKIAIKIAGEIKKILTDANKMFRQKIDFGISVNYGSIIAKKENEGLKFMGIGASIINSKRLAANAKGEVLLSETIKNRTAMDIKTEKIEVGGLSGYILKEVKNTEVHKDFINKFMKRNE